MSTLQYPQPTAVKPSMISHVDPYTHDLESGLAPLSRASSTSTTPPSPSPSHPSPSPHQNHQHTSAARPQTRNISTSHLLSPSSEKLPGLSVAITQTDDAAWPTRERLLEEKRAASRQKCTTAGGLAGRVRRVRLGLSKKQVLWMKIVLGLLIVGLAVGLGVGVSRKVGGGVWAGKGGANVPIGSHS